MSIKKTTNTFFPSSISPTPAPVHWEPTHESWKAELPERSNLGIMVKCSAIPAHEHKLSQLKIISAIPAHEHKLSQPVTIRRPAGLQDPRLFPCKARNHRRLPITSHPMHCLKAFCHWVLRQPQVASVVGAFSVDSGEPKDQ